MDTYTTFQFLTYNKNSLANTKNLHVVAWLTGNLGGALDFTPHVTIEIALHEQLTKKNILELVINSKNMQNYLDEITLERFCTGRYLILDHILYTDHVSHVLTVPCPFIFSNTASSCNDTPFDVHFHSHHETPQI